MFTIGIDVGGTYTDLVAIDDQGKAVFAQIAVDAPGPIHRRDGRTG